MNRPPQSLVRHVPTVDVVIPVYNEAHVLARSINRLHAFLGSNFAYRWRIVIANNASTDETMAVALQLAEELPRVSIIHLDQKGRGCALRRAWLQSDADILAYMDVDLSTDLAEFPALIRAIASGGVLWRPAPGWHLEHEPPAHRSARSSPAPTTC